MVKNMKRWYYDGDKDDTNDFVDNYDYDNDEIID